MWKHIGEMLPLENYSIQAKNLLESIVQDYESVLGSIHQDTFYLSEIKKIRLSINGRIRKISDLAEIKNDHQDNFFTIIVFNEDYYELLNEELQNLELDTKKEGQFIKVFKKELTYNQLMSIVDDIEKIRNKTLTKCSKAKSEPVIRARTALENEFIEPAISRETFNQCEILQKKATDLIDLITQKRIKEILGKINFEKYINEKI
tara:strand:+ start:1975 stop:2589 length:615 start_codon:yes stop_codon:yes gene_type:complete